MSITRELKTLTFASTITGNLVLMFISPEGLDIGPITFSLAVSDTTYTLRSLCTNLDWSAVDAEIRLGANAASNMAAARVISHPAGAMYSYSNGASNPVLDDGGLSVVAEDIYGLVIDVNLSSNTSTTTREISSSECTTSTVSVTSSNTNVVAANSDRLGITIYNQGSAIAYTKLGTTATTSSYTIKIDSGGYYEAPYNYTGNIDAITSSGTATLRVSEFS